tara:strand:+ start:30606 stop:31175 length:570 start_codon:yes stop_codon:yes gene_type:complete
VRFKNLYLVFILLIFYGCNQSKSSVIIDASNIFLKLDNGVLFYKDEPFNGNLVTYYSDKNLKSQIQYKNGRKEGYEKHWFLDNRLSIERYYTNGLKTSIHKAWWEDGTQKFEYHFNDKGNYNGKVKEWYKTGQVFRDFNYVDGKEIGSQRLWKIDGTIKANYKVVNEERFGLIGLKKCYTVTVGSDEVK